MTRTRDRFVLCVDRGTYQASLEPRKIYRVLADPAAEAKSMIRVVDDSGEDYLFPATLFVPIDVPEDAMPVFVGEVSERR